MTKTEKNQEVTRMFYEYCEQRGFIADDEGFGYWMVAKQGSARADEMFQVSRRGFEVVTHLCECENALEFAKQLDGVLENWKRMFEL
tara:strand:+ start:183 stop:443 length:261 start_codon:yes stop_codon:yes gene_type:complete